MPEEEAACDAPQEDVLTPENPEEIRAATSLSPKFSILPGGGQIYCVRFSQDCNYLAASDENGSICIYDTLYGKLAFALREKTGGCQLPTTMVRWRPQLGLDKARLSKGLLVSVSCDGRILHWNVDTRKKVSEIQEVGNQLFCVDYRPDGDQFATSGLKRAVHVYDAGTMKLMQAMSGGDGRSVAGHANRIFSLKYDPADHNVIVTGSWDKMLQIWDLRLGHAVRTIYGPYVCGDSVDVSDDGRTILAGSWRTESQLELWDMRTAKILEAVPWPKARGAETCQIYGAQFSKGDGHNALILAGGSGENEARLIDRQRDWSVCGDITGFGSGVFAVDFAGDNSMVAASSCDGTVRVSALDEVWGAARYR